MLHHNKFKISGNSPFSIRVNTYFKSSRLYLTDIKCQIKGSNKIMGNFYNKNLHKNTKTDIKKIVYFRWNKLNSSETNYILLQCE